MIIPLILDLEELSVEVRFSNELIAKWSGQWAIVAPVPDSTELDELEIETGRDTPSA